MRPSARSPLARLGDVTVRLLQVSTWGVFPRPEHISAAYGGGRNLKPGQALESEEQRKVRCLPRASLRCARSG